MNGDLGLRVWCIVNPPASPTYHHVASPDEGARFIDALANEQLKNDSIWMNAFGLQRFTGREEDEDGWEEWCDENGDDIDYYIERLEEAGGEP